MKVVFFHRKRIAGNFSIEALFDQIRSNLPAHVSWKVEDMKFQSKGLVRRLLGGWQAFFRQGQLNHVTGDIHFVALFLPGRKTVLTVHDIGFIENKKGLPALLLKWFWIQWPVRHCAVITTVSQATKNEILKFSQAAAPKIKVIYNPINELFKPNSGKFNTVCPVILQVGTKYNKNIERLIEAVKEISCVVYFLGQLEPRLLQLLNESNLKYKQYENLSVPEVVELYVTCDIVSFVSTVEGFGMPIIEANAVGRVVITSNISSMPEVAGNAAHLVDPFDVESIRSGIKNVIEDEEYRNRLIRNGFENAKRFDARQIAGEYAQVYNEMINQKVR